MAIYDGQRVAPLLTLHMTLFENAESSIDYRRVFKKVVPAKKVPGTPKRKLTGYSEGEAAFGEIGVNQRYRYLIAGLESTGAAKDALLFGVETVIIARQ